MNDDPLVVDLFAGPGGWSQGVRDAGYTGRMEGVEWDAGACATAIAAGHNRLEADVTTLDPLHFGPIWGLLASPPCEGFTLLGRGKGRADSEHLLNGLRTVRDLETLLKVIDELKHTMTDPRSILALEPLRFMLAARPQWTAWEQVPAVLPLWEACAEILRTLGYTVETGVLNCEQFGVPQTRQRAILVARAPGLVSVKLPTPTHSRYHRTNPKKLDAEVKPWVSILDVLGRPEGAPKSKPVWFVHNCGHRNRPRGEDGRRIVRDGDRDWYLRFALDRPCPTVTSGSGAAKWDNGEPLDDGISYTTGRWHRKMTVQEMSLIQTFPADYPWQGTLGSQFRQVGDAVPPLLAQRIFETVADFTPVGSPLLEEVRHVSTTDEDRLLQNLARVVSYAERQLDSADIGRTVVAECVLAALDADVLENLRDRGLLKVAP